MPQAATAAAAALCVTDRAGVQPIGCRLSPRSRAVTYDIHTQPWSAV